MTFVNDTTNIETLSTKTSLHESQTLALVNRSIRYCTQGDAKLVKGTTLNLLGAREKFHTRGLHRGREKWISARQKTTEHHWTNIHHGFIQYATHPAFACSSSAIRLLPWMIACRAKRNCAGARTNTRSELSPTDICTT